MLRWLVASVLLVGVLSAASLAPEKAVAPPEYGLGNGAHISSYTGPMVKILGSDTLTAAMISTRDYQANGPTPTRLWAVPEVCGIYATLFCRNLSFLRWNFYEFSQKNWVASDTGFPAYEEAGYGNMAVKYDTLCQYQYYPFWSAHEYVTGTYYPDLWWPGDLTFCPFEWGGDFNYFQGERSDLLWPRIGFTQSGYLHQITTDGTTYNIYYNRISDICNPFWFGAIEIVSTGDGPWYTFATDPFGKTIALSYCRTSSDNHIIMLIDTTEGEMFYAGNPLEIDLSDELFALDTLSLGFVGDGMPFFDRDGNIHHFLFGSNGETVVPLHIWHFFYDLSADTMSWSPVKFIDDTLIQASVGINTLWAGRAQLGQNRYNGNLYAIWEEFVLAEDRFAISSTNDTFPPTMVQLAKSTDNGLTWEIETLLVSDVDFGNVWLRFPVISPIIPSQIDENEDTVDAVVWGVHEDDDPGFTWQGQGVDTTQVMWVNVPTGQIGVSEASKTISLNRVDVWSSANPVQEKAKITFQMPRKGEVSLAIFDRAGRHIKTLLKGAVKEGTHSVAWDLRDNRNVKVPSGVYFYVLKAFGESYSNKLVVSR